MLAHETHDGAPQFGAAKMMPTSNQSRAPLLEDRRASRERKRRVHGKFR